MWGCIDSVRAGEATVAVSCGNTGALMAIAMIRLRRLPGVNRPAIACLWPSRNPGGYNLMLDAGADIVNDVAAMTYDSAMAGLVAERGVPVCLMHAQGDPATMQDDPRYDDVVLDVFDWLSERISAAQSAGIARDKIIVDPGIGFGKTLQHNVSLLQNLSIYHDLGFPILLGASRKRFIGTIGNAPDPLDRVAGSVAVALHGAAQAVQILRVHDTFETRQALSLQQAIFGTDIS